MFTSPASIIENSCKITADALCKARILVVDDQPPNVLLLKKILSNAGYQQVTTTTDPHQVQPLHQTEAFDLILLDIHMPELDGFGVMELLRQDAGDDYVPILVLTASNDDETKNRALENGAKDFLSKPFNRIEALNRIRNMLEVRLLHNHLRQQNEQLGQMVQRRTAQVEATQLEIIHRLGRAAEFRDNETALHIIRMSKYAALVAKQAGFDDEMCNLVLNASPMHDIGKIGIPDYVLLKAGKLDAEEWKIMKGHCAIGARILSGHDSPLISLGSEIALNHHERWDGSGYPNGFSGEQIPIIARIVAIADVFDALTSSRPYKEAWPLEEALEEIRKSTGSHFDPAIAGHFFAILPKIIEVKERHQNQSKTDLDAAISTPYY
ncbi:MAG: response regulator [Candidatus Polarisedimenticolaceae bacterium]|nr:response regulator [Candidatus Polarisedimenticolaceae bacterium]